MRATTVAIASDHAGYDLENALKAWVEEHGLGTLDLGPHVVRDCLDAFLRTPREGGRHQRRIDKMS